MEVLVTYDVATETTAGRRRLRQIAKLCEAHGQRVQKSVFECQLNAGDLEALRHKLSKAVNEKEDSLRIYRLQEPRERYVQVIGRRPAHDLHEPLVL